MTAGGPPVRVVVSCDGGARGNPGPAGIGVTISTPGGRVLDEVGAGIGPATNNVAEYSAVLEGLRRAKALGAREAIVRSDSQLLVRQLQGRYRVKNATLARLHAEVRAVARTFDRVEYRHVPREENRRADELVNQGIDAWQEENPEAGAPARAHQAEMFDR